jgi:hypothetical protein
MVHLYVLEENTPVSYIQSMEVMLLLVVNTPAARTRSMEQV